MGEPLEIAESFSDKALRALHRASADAIELHRRNGVPLVYAEDGKVIKIMAEDLLKKIQTSSVNSWATTICP